MKDLRLPTADVKIGEKEYHLAMNMNVLADLQDAADGNILKILSDRKSFSAGMTIGAALLNEACEASGAPERFEAKALGRILPPREGIKFAQLCMDMLVASLTSDEDEEAEEKSEKN